MTSSTRVSARATSFTRPELGRTKVHFAFPKRDETLAEAARRLRRIG